MGKEAMDLSMLTCAWLPERFVLYEKDPALRTVQLQPRAVLGSMLCFSQFSWIKARHMMNQTRDLYKASKNAYYAFRILELGAQLLEYGRIRDLQAANHWWEAIDAMFQAKQTSLDWWFKYQTSFEVVEAWFARPLLLRMVELIEIYRTQRLRAFAMALHYRVGAHSPARRLAGLSAILGLIADHLHHMEVQEDEFMREVITMHAQVRPGVYEEASDDEHGEEASTCGICTNDLPSVHETRTPHVCNSHLLVPNHKCITLICGHTFHEDCLDDQMYDKHGDKWRSSSKLCATCMVCKRPCALALLEEKVLARMDGRERPLDGNPLRYHYIY